MSENIFEKIWRSHVVAEVGTDATLVLIDRVFLHERTGSVALKSLKEAGRAIMAPAHVFCTMDHIVDTFPGRSDKTLMPTGTAFITETRAAAHEAGITLFDLDDERQGIVHVISPEQGIVLPGLTLVCPDSHTCTQGAFGALAWGIGSTDAEHALATSTLRIKKPKTMRITVTGQLGEGVTAKDLALYLLARYSAGGGKGHVIEYAGPAIEALEMEARMTLCNMATEFAAFSAVIAPDDKTFAYLKGRPYAPKGADWDLAVENWRALRSDTDASYDKDYVVDAADVGPMITWGTSPQHATTIDGKVPSFAEVSDRDSREAYDRAMTYMDLVPGTPLQDLKIDSAFIGSCTNSRISDLRRAAAILKGRKVAAGVKAICVPGSMAVKRAAEAEGLDVIFKDAGFEWREAGCSMCFFAGGESMARRARVVTSTNRNFESRQGPETRSHLASPEMVAASAIAGHLADPRKLER
ncbi:3-isopropylmalate dehydratase large subunit [Govanella unica]|uniref:3-isopropylmalate dehydratase n=1 Tax=Govanella unica TaxID=2975056 RepID=A0A9X3TWK2_9PROT|nr:3-isopropylmalate dehydratase large subunit [Govania unica]